MKKSKCSEHQIINILKEYESGKATKDICREHGISAPTFYQWKQKYGGMDAQHLKELKGSSRRKLPSKTNVCRLKPRSSYFKRYNRKQNVVTHEFL